MSGFVMRSQTSVFRKSFTGGATSQPSFSFPEYDNSSLFWSGYEVKYPQEGGKYGWQKPNDFITFFKGGLPDNFDDIYPQKTDVDNIIDYFIQINILGAFDNSGNNVYIARKNQSSPYI